MGEYTDEKGVVYSLEPEWTTGEIVILSDDKAAWKVKRSVLSDASPVFRDMFANASSRTNEVNLPDAKRKDLDIFVRALCQKTPPSDLSIAQTSRAIDLLCQYECSDAARRLLYANTKSVDAEHLFPAFALASRLGDVVTACRVLAQGHNSYEHAALARFPTLCPDCTEYPWSVAEAEQIAPSWVWALSLAFTQLDKMPVQRDTFDPVYWSFVVGCFMCHLCR